MPDPRPSSYDPKIVEEQARLIAKLKHPQHNPSAPFPGSMGDPLWHFYVEDAECVLNLIGKFRKVQ